YEQTVLRHVRSLAVDGVVPCEALTTGTDEEAGAWRKAFDKAVVADARRRGLIQRRWSRPMQIVVGVAALVPAAFVAAAIAAIPPAQSASQQQHDSSDDVMVGLGVWIVLVAAMSIYRAHRPTKAGRAAWARWLGLQEYLGRDENFASAPPAAVAIWDRYLAYGVALGVAP